MPTRQRLSPVERRRLILDAARALVVERGLAATTAREIAGRAGISTGTVTHHFPTVHTIVAEALREASTEFTDRFLAAAWALPDARDRIAYVIDANLPDAEGAGPLWRLWIEVWGRAVHDVHLAAVHSERHAFERRALELLIRDGVARGELRSPDPFASAATLLALLEGLGLQAALGDLGVDVEAARLLLHGYAERELYAPRA